MGEVAHIIIVLFGHSKYMKLEIYSIGFIECIHGGRTLPLSDHPSAPWQFYQWLYNATSYHFSGAGTVFHNHILYYFSGQAHVLHHQFYGQAPVALQFQTLPVLWAVLQFHTLPVLGAGTRDSTIPWYLMLALKARS